MDQPHRLGAGLWPNKLPPGIANVIGIAAGMAHNLALKADGTVIAWGYNYFGQCNVPAGLTNVVAIKAGANFSLALKSDGTLTAWGPGTRCPH